MSLHSPLSPASGRSAPDLFTTDDMPLPPQRAIERMSSYPSLSHSSTTAASDDQHEPAAIEILTPLDNFTFAAAAGVKDQYEEQELLSPVQEKRGFRGLTKSMQSLRGRAKADRERSRSSSRERPPMPVVQSTFNVATTARPAQPIAIPAPTRPKAQRSGSSFSSFIRKLTGKSAKPASPVTVPAPIPAFKQDRPSPPSRKPTLAINTGAASPVARPVHLRKTSLPLDLAVPIPAESVVEAPPLTAPPRAPTIKLVDPRSVPLPPSPPSPAVVLADEESLDFSLSPSSYDRVTSSALSLQVSKDSAPSKRIIEEEDENEEEGDDVVRPLPGSSANQSGRVSTSPVSASTVHEAEVRTPLSPSFPSNREAPLRSPTAQSSSPPRLAAPMASRKDSTVRKDQGPTLGRKESKWRKSVMNLSESLNGPSKRVSKAPPPTSYDAYLLQQQRIANNRRSCAPTLHSTGTVSAEIRQIKDKEQQDMADTFFLS